MPIYIYIYIYPLVSCGNFHQLVYIDQDFVVQIYQIFGFPWVNFRICHKWHPPQTRNPKKLQRRVLLPIDRVPSIRKVTDYLESSHPTLLALLQCLEGKRNVKPNQILLMLQKSSAITPPLIMGWNNAMIPIFVHRVSNLWITGAGFLPFTGYTP